MRELRARHDSRPAVRARIAFLLIEEELYPQADSILDALLRLDSTNVEWLAWRAQGAFEAGAPAAPARRDRARLATADGCRRGSGVPR